MSDLIYRRAPEALFSEVGDDVVALHIDRGQCYGMEQVSSAVWKLLAEPRGVDAICAHLVDHYDVEPGDCRAEVGTFLAQLEREGLVETIGDA